MMMLQSLTKSQDAYIRTGGGTARWEAFPGGTKLSAQCQTWHPGLEFTTTSRIMMSSLESSSTQCSEAKVDDCHLSCMMMMKAVW